MLLVVLVQALGFALVLPVLVLIALVPIVLGQILLIVLVAQTFPLMNFVALGLAVLGLAVLGLVAADSLDLGFVDLDHFARCLAALVDPDFVDLDLADSFPVLPVVCQLKLC